MSRRVLTIIITLTSISLMAALITQLFWVRDAWLLKRDYFDKSVKISLKSVVNQLMASEKTYTADMVEVDNDTYWEHVDLFSVVNPDILDSLINAEFSTMRINTKFDYGVYRNSDKLFVMGNTKGYSKELLDSPHWISLTCLCHSGHYLLAAYFPNKESLILNQMIILPVMSGLFLMVLIFSFFFTIYSVLKQKKLSEMKTDFVNNMTHEFKTPISTISVSSEMLTNEAVFSFPDKVRKYAKIIFDENTRLKNLVERVLQIAIIDRGGYKLKMKETDVHEIIGECINNFEVQINGRNGKLIQNLLAAQHMIIADREHLTNIISNLLDNANKYSPENPEIVLTTRNIEGKIQIDISDNGIGIKRENQNDVFKKFHRLQSGNIHDAKGFGIGLFYVKTMMEKMGGQVELRSELNKGSIFILSFPV